MAKTCFLLPSSLFPKTNDFITIQYPIACSIRRVSREFKGLTPTPSNPNLSFNKGMIKNAEIKTVFIFRKMQSYFVIPTGGDSSKAIEIFTQGFYLPLCEVRNKNAK